MYKDSRNECTSLIKTISEGLSNTNPNKKKKEKITGRQSLPIGNCNSFISQLPTVAIIRRSIESKTIYILTQTPVQDCLSGS